MLLKIKNNNTMNKIREKIKTKDDFDIFCTLLSDRIKHNEPISGNAMIDGMAISFIFTTGEFAIDLFLNREMGRVLDGTIQKLEQIVIWVTNNEDELCKLMDIQYTKV